MDVTVGCPKRRNKDNLYTLSGQDDRYYITFKDSRTLKDATKILGDWKSASHHVNGG